MKCPSCQFENPRGSKFCLECGEKLEIRCPSCGQALPLGAKFCNECGHDLAVSSEPPLKELTFEEKISKIQRYLPKGVIEKVLSQRDRIEGERKQVTVMFCDMEGFTALSERLGPEEAYAIMDQVYEILIHQVHRYEGTVNEMTGDGIMALFGAPIALEDAPQRAIRSTYAIHREMTKFSDSVEREKQGISHLKMRIGIHTGPVIVGTLGNDLRVEFKAVGDTVNLASRVEGLAEPGTTYVTEDTFKLTEGLFRFEGLGEKEIKGREQPIKVYRAIGLRTARTRFDVSAERGLTPFVGRERELELLLDGFERAKVGRGQAFSIMAEAGVGKSRLLYEFRKAIANEDVTFIEGRCLSYSRNVAYHPVIDTLKSNFDIREGDGDSEIREKVERGLRIVGADEASTLPYLLELLSVKDSGIDKIPMSPEARKDRIIEALNRNILKGSDIRPVVMAIEDLHWMDKSSEERFRSLLDSISGARVFLIFTYRPEFVHTWGGRSYHSQVNLNRLSNRESLAMVAYLLSTEDVAKDLEELILEKTEGVPFFVEEFVKSLKDLKIIEREDGKFYLARDIRDVAIPSTIQDVVMARVDSLPEGAKEVLQIGSVIGREFGYKLIKEVTELPEQELLSRLSILKDSELLYERGIYPQSTYIFKHALTQDATFQSLLKTRREKYHLKIAQVLEQSYPEITETEPELLGHHLTEASLSERAIPCWHRASEIAIRRSAPVEAISHLSNGIELLQNLPDTPERIRQELSFQIAIAPQLAATKGWASPEVEKAYNRALVLCQKVGDTRQRFWVLWGLWGINNVRAEYQTSCKLSKELMQLAQVQQEDEYLIGAHRALGSDLFYRGEIAESRFHQERVIALYNPQEHHRLAYIHWTDPGVAALSYMPLILWLLGFPDQALQRSHQALALAHELSHSYSLAVAIHFSLLLHFFRRDISTIQERAETLIKFSTEKRFPVPLAVGNLLRSWAMWMEGEGAEAIKQIRWAASAMLSTGMKQAQYFSHALVAEVFGNLGKLEEGLHELAEAQALVNETGERLLEAELYRLRGNLLLALSVENQSEAEACFHQALEVARRQQAKSLELRATMSLSRLWQKQGKVEEARGMLAEIYGWFTEGFDTADLQEAKTLLEGLS